MTNDVKNVPEWRFAGFVDEWEKKLLNEIANVQMGQSPNSKNYTDDSQEMILVQGNADLKNGKVFPRIFTKEITKLANIGDILLSVRAPVGEIGISQMPVCIGRGVCSITSNLFIYYFLDYFNNENKWKKFSQGSTFESISGNEVRSLIIYSPSKTEQQKIGDFFSKLDRQIELEEQKLEKLEEQKKGYMQKIFSQELRFKDEKGNDYPEWDITTIEKIAKVSKGFTPSTKDINLWQNDNKNWLSIAGMSDKYIYEGNKGISSAGEGKHKKVNEDTLIMSFKLTLGKLAIVKTPIYTNEAICHFEWKTDQIKTEYMYYYLSFINIESFGAQAVKGITLNNDSINSIVIKLPEFLEQNKISNFFTKFDELMEKQNQKIDGLKKRKKGFLQKMFV